MDAKDQKIAELQDALSAIREANMRLTDLVRYTRHDLFEDGLITPEEYAALVSDSDNGQRVARLEGYDALTRKVAALEAENAQLKGTSK